MIIYIDEYTNQEETEIVQREYLNDGTIVSCTVNQTENDFSLSIEAAEHPNSFRIGSIFRVDVGGVPFEFRIEKISYTDSTGTTSISAKYRGYDLNGIYPLPVRGAMMMRTPKDAAETVMNWRMFGGYKGLSFMYQYEDSEANVYAVSEVSCEEDGFLFPFYMSTAKSVADIMYNDIAGAIGYQMRPYNVRDFKIVKPSDTITAELVHGVNISDFTVERSFTEKPTGVFAFYKNPSTATFSGGDSDSYIPGRLTAYDASSECDESYPAGIDLSDQAEAYFAKTNPIKKGIDFVYNVVPTPDVKGLFVGDWVRIDLTSVDINNLEWIGGDYTRLPETRIKSLLYDCINECYTSITIGAKKSDYIDLMISQSAESDRLDSVVYKTVLVPLSSWSDDNTYSFTQGSASLIKFAEVTDILSSDMRDYYNGLYSVRVVGFTGDATKTVTIKIDRIPYDDVYIKVKMWKRG